MSDSKQIKKKIIELTKEYYNTLKNEKKTFKAGERINYSGRFYDESELVNLIDSSLEFWLTSGRYTNEFEKELEKYLGVKHALFVNSGSSANLLAFMALTSPMLGEKRIRRGDEVITTAAAFPTTISPAIQYGAVPVFVDINLDDCNIDIYKLENALSKKTKAVIIAHTLGNPFNISAVKEFCKKNNLFLIEDNCDALGSQVFVDGEWRLTGTIGDIGTSSFYPPHHITTGEGGAVYTSNDLLKKILLSMRDWGRDCQCPPGKDNCCSSRFSGKHGTLPEGYDHKYVYSNLGYNLKATDMQAAIGCAQIKKLDYFTRKRRENYDFLISSLSDLNGKLSFMRASENSRPSWFGFLITVNDKNIKREYIVKYLENCNIQTRMLFSGNITRHPCFKGLIQDQDYRISGGLENTDYIMENSFWIGVYPGMTEEKLQYMSDKIHECLK
jgi:CDP-6-deoxy-D-xylo-4-hexulose-3-dehydrase